MTLLVATVSTAVLAAGVVLNADIVLAVGAVGLIVAFSGRLGTAVQLRWQDQELPQPPSSDLGAAGIFVRRRSTRRASGIAYVWSAFGALLILAASADGVPPVESDREAALLFSGFGGTMIVAAVLLGPVARFVVTGSQLRIDTAFRRTSIPRALISAFSPSGLTVRIELIDGDYRDIRVDSPLLDAFRGSEYRHNSRCQVRTMRRIAALMRAVPATAGSPAGSSEEVESRRRLGMIAVTVLVAAAMTAVIAISW